MIKKKHQKLQPTKIYLIKRFNVDRQQSKAWLARATSTLDRWHDPHSHPGRSTCRKLSSCQKVCDCYGLAKRQRQQMPEGSHQRHRHWPHFHPNVNTSPSVWTKTNTLHVLTEFWCCRDATLDTDICHTKKRTTSNTIFVKADRMFGCWW